jgi:hypothetical protein
MKSKLFVLIIGFALFGGSSLASAAIVTITFSGTIDPVGSPGFYSGTVGGFSPLSFQGQTLNGSFSYDNSSVVGTPNGLLQNYIVPSVPMTLSIGAIDFSISGAGGSLVQLGINGPGSPNQLIQIEEFGSGGHQAELGIFGVGSNLFSNQFDLSSVFSSTGTGHIKLTDFSAGLGLWDVHLDSVVISSPVPEPSTWTMVILGFAGLGFMAYRRKNAHRFA